MTGLRMMMCAAALTAALGCKQQQAAETTKPAETPTAPAPAEKPAEPTAPAPAEPTAAAPAAPAEAPTATADGWKPGDEVDIEWKGEWWKGRVVALEDDKIRIHYDGYSDRWDETVAPERVRARTEGSRQGAE
jgi:hypothetical protein